MQRNAPKFQITWSSLVLGTAILLYASESAVLSGNSGTDAETRSTNEVTAIDQGNSPADMETTRKIRADLMERGDLSAFGKNALVITQDGVVTLKGHVRSKQEKRIIEQCAVKVAGKSKVKNELQIIPAK